MLRAQQRFDLGQLDGLDEPVRRYLSHAIDDGATLCDRVHLVMSGRIKVVVWLAFEAEQDISGRSFAWRARAGLGPLKPLHVEDRYRDGAGSTEGRVLGRFPFLRANGENTTRSAAGRAAVESIWAPAMLLPGRGVSWRAEADDSIIASFAFPPERPDVRLRIDARGAPRSVSIMRWGDAGDNAFGFVPFGGHIHAQRRFGGLVLPSEVSVGWWFGTPRFTPFFEATILEADSRS